MMKVKVIILGFFFIIGGFFYYYYYVQTLKLSEIIGYSSDPISNILTSVFDFDTGLTRHDIYQIKKKQDYWLRRIEKVESINDPQVRDIEMTKLIDEMLRDPSMRKLTKLIGIKGLAIGENIIKLIK